MKSCTVVIPTLNPPEDFLPRVKGLISSFRNSAQWIVVNDGSGPQYGQLWDQLSTICTVVHHDKNKGLAAARNTGFRSANTKYVLPLDDDDWVSPRLLSSSIPKFEANRNVAFVYSWVILEGQEKGVLVTPQWDTQEMLRRNICCSCSIINLEAWEAVGGYDETFLNGLEDWDLWVRLIEHGYVGELVPAPLIKYLRKKSSMLSDLHSSGIYWRERERMLKKYHKLYNALLDNWTLELEQQLFRPPPSYLRQILRYIRTYPLRFR